MKPVDVAVKPLDVAGEPVDVPKEPRDIFGPLKAVLEGILAVHDHIVCSPPLLKDFHRLTHPQDIRNKTKNILSRVVALEQLFKTTPGDMAEQRRRRELMPYVVTPPLDLMLSSFQKARGCRKPTAAIF